MKLFAYRFILGTAVFLVATPAFNQSQTCPANSNFSFGNLTNWSAYTGNNKGGNGPDAILVRYSVAGSGPSGTIGVNSINELGISVPGIQVITTQGTDFFGGFPTIPVINGYDYKYSVLLGSTSVTPGGNPGGGPQGGYIRGISYLINVPTSAVVEPYTMTYAYAMVLENGTHNSDQQPLISVKIVTANGLIDCASPSYLLPTFNDATPNNGGSSLGATLDTAGAVKNGFSLSSQLSPNLNRNSGGYLQDVWTKAWTEVTFDLSPFRGQQVTLTFEADNCVPGGHFAYGYIALRNTCAGLTITGNAEACTNGEHTYSIPSLAEGSYTWEVPDGWAIISGATDNILKVRPGVNGGKVIAHEINGCADLRDTLEVITKPPTVPGILSGSNHVCSGTNISPLSLNGYNGNILKWIASTDNGISWRDVAAISSSYIAQNLTTTTTYKALVQNGPSCSLDTSTAAIVKVDAKTIAGRISPAEIDICMGQNKDAFLTLAANTGNVINWQSSFDNINWTSFNPSFTNSVYSINGVGVPTYFRIVVQNGICPPEVSEPALVNIVNVRYPQAIIYPADTTICYGDSVDLKALVTIGTSYKWKNLSTLSDGGNGIVPGDPPVIVATASPRDTSKYILQIENAGCPNLLSDTFLVNVYPRILLNAGNDTAVVVNQSVQLRPTVSGDPSDYLYKWTPSFGLNTTTVINPIIQIGNSMESSRYLLTVTSSAGCTASDEIYVRIFKTAADVFVPNAFTPTQSSNKVFRPVPAGIAALRFFKVFNRWGQLVYSTSTVGQGWDGMYNGKIQHSSSYVWMLEATTYDGRKISKKGTMVLVR